MMLGSSGEHDPVCMIRLEKLNLCLFVALCVVVLLEMADLVCEIGNVIVKIVRKTVICVRAVTFTFLYD